MYSRAPGGQKPFLKKKKIKNKNTSVVCTRKFYSLNLLTVTRTVTDYSRDVMPRGFCRGEGFPRTRLPPKKKLGQWFKYHTYSIQPPRSLFPLRFRITCYALMEKRLLFTRARAGTDVRIVNYYYTLKLTHQNGCNAGVASIRPGLRLNRTERTKTENKQKNKK